MPVHGTPRLRHRVSNRSLQGFRYRTMNEFCIFLCAFRIRMNLIIGQPLRMLLNQIVPINNGDISVLRLNLL